MERAALVAAARDRGVEEVEIEMRVVPDQDRALAAVLAHGFAHGREHQVERDALGLGVAEGVVEDDAGDLQRLGVDLVPAAGTTWLLVISPTNSWPSSSMSIGRHCDLEQGVAVPVEAAGFHVHHDGQEAAEARGEAGRAGFCAASGIRAV